MRVCICCRPLTPRSAWSVSSGRCISRVPGMAVYLGESASGLPSAFVSMLKSVGVVQQTVVFLNIKQVGACS